MAEDETSWKFSSILESIKSVSRALETLRSEHESLLATVKTSEPLEDKDIDNDFDPEVVKETKEATLAQSINTLNKGLQEANILMAVLQYIGTLEGERGKLKAQVRRLADENNWLRQELQKVQQLLQETEVELGTVQEEKHHLNYMMSLPKISSDTMIATEGMETTEDEEATEEEPSLKSLSGKSSSIDTEKGSSEHFQKLHQYALQHMNQGRHDVAVSLCKKAVQEIEESHGRFHPERGNMINVMVVIYREQGKLKEAVKLLLEVLEIREKNNGRDHQMVASTLNNLSVLYGKMGDFKTAEPLCRRALEIRQKLLGASHPDVAQQLINLATICQHLGKYEEVEWYYQRALEIYQTEYGADDPHVIKTLNYLGKCYMKQGKLEAAEMVFKKVRSTVQGQDSNVGRDSREQSGSPTSLFGRESSPVEVKPSPPEIKRSSSAHRLQNDAVRQTDAIRRSSSDIRPTNVDIIKPKQARSSVSSNVLRFFRWGSSTDTNPPSNQ